VIRAIAANSIDAWLEKLASDAEVLVPQQREGEDVVLGPLGSAPRATNYLRLSESPKRILMPQMDDLVRFERGRRKAVLDRTRRILFGLRACDAAAIAALDEFFRRDYPDPHYLARREHMRLIVAACTKSEETCFCISAGSGPVAVDGFDVQLFDLGEIYLAEAGTPAGERMMDRGGRLFTDPPPDADRRMKEFRENSEATQKTRLDLQRAQRIIRNGTAPAGFWEQVANRCLTCGGCAYLCPTCTCYDLQDRVEIKGKGIRRRLWDSCILGGFTREAGGHNPRGQQPSRLAHRYLHKLGGADVPGRAFRCVGCGRCDEVCMTHLGMIRVVTELLEQVPENKNP